MKRSSAVARRDIRKVGLDIEQRRHHVRGAVGHLRYTRDMTEIRPRYARDTPEIHPRYSRDAPEI